jgi:hypothetical protein
MKNYELEINEDRLNSNQLLLLNDLSTINWSVLKHAYGNASDTPQNLINLLSNDKEERIRAMDELEDSICHQEYQIHDSSLASLPILLSIALNPEADQRERIVELIANIGKGNGAFQGVKQSKYVSEAFSAEKIETEVKKEESLQGQIRSFISTKKPIWIRFLEDKDPKVMGNALQLLATIRNADDGIFSILLKNISKLEDYGKANALSALPTYGGNKAIPVLQQYINSDSEIVRLSAITGLIVLNSPLEEEILDFIVVTIKKYFTKTIKRWDPSRSKKNTHLEEELIIPATVEFVETCLHCPYPLTGYLCEILRKNYSQHADKLLSEILEEGTFSIDYLITYTLMLAANPQDPPFIAGRLNPLQIRTIYTIIGLQPWREKKWLFMKRKKKRIDTEKLERIKPTLDQFGIPSDLEGITVFLGDDKHNN